MADFGSFQAQTPQEVLAKLAQNRSQVMVSGNVQQQRSQNIETALDGLFGNPQVRQAKRLETALKTAQSANTQRDGEDPLDFELRRLQSMRDAVADVDPATASQINAKMLEVGETKFQRKRLMAADTRAEEEHTAKMAESTDEAKMRKLTGGSTYVLNQKDGSVAGFDLLDQNDVSGFQKAAAQPGTIVITPAQAFSLYHDKSVEAMKMRQKLAGADDFSKVTSKDVEKASAGLLDLYATTDRLFQVLETNPDALSQTSAGAMKFEKVATELAAAGRAASGNKLKDGTPIDDWMASNSITNNRAQSLIVALAAANARANNPDGRISDRDMVIATQMVGGNNPNPAVVMSNLNDTLTRSSQALFDRLDTLPEGVKEQLAERRKLLGERADSFQARFAKYTNGAQGPDATGRNAPDSDGWITMPNGVKVRKKP